MSCWFSLSPFPSFQKRVQAHLPASVNARSSSSTTFCSVCSSLVLWPFVSEPEKCYICVFRGEMDGLPAPLSREGHQPDIRSDWWTLQRLCVPMGGTNLCKAWAHTFVLPTTRCAENFQNPREKAEYFRFYFVFQCQLWNTQNVLVEQKFPRNLVAALPRVFGVIVPEQKVNVSKHIKGKCASFNEPLELVPLFLLTMAKTSPQKPELLLSLGVCFLGQTTVTAVGWYFKKSFHTW